MTIVNDSGRSVGISISLISLVFSLCAIQFDAFIFVVLNCWYLDISEIHSHEKRQV